MSKPIITKLRYTYKKADSNVWVLNTNDIPVDMSLVKDQQLVYLAPQSASGNHSHERIEWFVGIGDLNFIWLDQSGKRNVEPMNPGGELLLFEVPPHLAHAVQNTSKTQMGLLFELANAKMGAQKKIPLV